MEGLANEWYNLIATPIRGTSYSTVFNMAWYALKPLPLGKKICSTAESVNEPGIFFSEYRGNSGHYLPERRSPIALHSNPGYDPTLLL